MYNILEIVVLNLEMINTENLSGRSQGEKCNKKLFNQDAQTAKKQVADRWQISDNEQRK